MHVDFEQGYRNLQKVVESVCSASFFRVNELFIDTNKQVFFALECQKLKFS